jgi:hypothetical protein
MDNALALYHILKHNISKLSFSQDTALAITTLFLAIGIIRLLLPDPEAAVNYTIKEPEQLRPGWEGEVLDEPSITVSLPLLFLFSLQVMFCADRGKKTRGSSAIQCYSPATGQLLGLVDPVTRDGIDQAISSAAEAQLEWAASPFQLRRKVLKTLLK